MLQLIASYYSKIWIKFANSQIMKIYFNFVEFAYIKHVFGNFRIEITKISQKT